MNGPPACQGCSHPLYTVCTRESGAGTTATQWEVDHAFPGRCTYTPMFPLTGSAGDVHDLPYAEHVLRRRD
ncbi:hypothetical protein ACIRO3_05725 [Streptomyces sp. NPDC102278]|uniref:hypothetical protein n=1 Tax=Streptomyces sp. NPDC102278 TaxID=3366152 RepID=UPI0038242FA0